MLTVNIPQYVVMWIDEDGEISWDWIPEVLEGEPLGYYIYENRSKVPTAEIGAVICYSDDVTFKQFEAYCSDNSLAVFAGQI